MACLLALATSCSRPPAAEPEVAPFDAPVESLRFEFDGREWTPAVRKREGKIVQEVFVLPGETAEEWTELVTRTLTYGAQRGANLQVLLKLKQATLEKDCPLVEWETLEADRRSALYEWTRPRCRDQDPQTEFGRFAFGRLGIHIVTYTAKTSRVAAGLRRQWIDSLRNATLEIRTADQASAPASD